MTPGMLIKPQARPRMLAAAASSIALAGAAFAILPSAVGRALPAPRPSGSSVEAEQCRRSASSIALRTDGGASFNDKESLTADPGDARYVYAVWDRLTGNNGPTWFARTTNAGTSWEAARNIYDPGINSQTLNNQIVVLPDGTLVNFFTELANVGAQNARLRIIRHADQGEAHQRRLIKREPTKTVSGQILAQCLESSALTIQSPPIEVLYR